MKRIIFRVLLLVSVILLASNFSIVARASGIVRHLTAWNLYSNMPVFGWEPVVIDLDEPWSALEWWEIYPNSDHWEMVDWEDIDVDGNLSASDHVKMHNFDTGEKQWFIVDRATIVIYWLWWDETTGWGGDAPPGFEPFAPCAAEFTYWPLPEEPYADKYGALPDPLNSEWHMIFPSWSRAFEITGWKDLMWVGYGTFSLTDEFDITFLNNGTGPWHAFLDELATDLVLTEIEDPSATLFIWHRVIQAIAIIEAIVIGILLLILVKKWGGPWGPPEPDRPEPKPPHQFFRCMRG